MSNTNDPGSKLSKVFQKITGDSNFTRLILNYSGWKSSTSFAATWKGKDLAIHMRFRLVQMIALIAVALHSTFFFMHLKDYENHSEKLMICLLELIATVIILMFYENWYQKIRLKYWAKVDIEPYFYKVLTITVESSFPFVCILIQSLQFPFDKAYDHVALIEHIPFMLLSILYLRFWLCFFSALIASLGRMALFLLIFPLDSENIDIADYVWGFANLLVCGLIMGTIAMLLRKIVVAAMLTSSEKNKLQDIFGRFVSKDVAEQIISKDLKIGGDNINASVLFLDIRNFTYRSSTMPPEDAVDFLNQLFNFTVAEVEKAGGIVNKFLGDGFMAVFGAPLSLPNPCNSAVLCSIQIFNKLNLFNASKTGEITKLGIGINFGPMVAGVMGTDTRKEYTVIGDVVNTASRIESLNKEFGSDLLISKSVYDKLDDSLKEQFESLPPTKVKGKDEPILIYKKI